MHQGQLTAASDAGGPGIGKLLTWELSPLFSVGFCDLLGVELHVRKGQTWGPDRSSRSCTA